jgi:hypothetical protein
MLTMHIYAAEKLRSLEEEHLARRMPSRPVSLRRSARSSFVAWVVTRFRRSPAAPEFAASPSPTHPSHRRSVGLEPLRSNRPRRGERGAKAGHSDDTPRTVRHMDRCGQ